MKLPGAGVFAARNNVHSRSDFGFPALILPPFGELAVAVSYDPGPGISLALDIFISKSDFVEEADSLPPLPTN